MSVTAVAFALCTALYTGFQWTIRLVVYPQFATVGAQDFARYELRHQQLVTRAVGPLFAALVVSTAALVWHPPADTSWWWRGLAGLLLGVILGVTALLAVPLHRKLSDGFDGPAHGRLLRVDTLRLVAAVADTCLAGYLLCR